MAKPKTNYLCLDCGFDSPKWLGRCPACGAWNTMSEMNVGRTDSRHANKTVSKPRAVTEIDSASLPRRRTGLSEFDRVLGGGIVPGSLILIGGDPGIGKSTLLLQVAGCIADVCGLVLYVSGEESDVQTRMRAERLNKVCKNLMILTETNIEHILKTAKELKPMLVVIDSIQTMHSADVPAAAGSIGQVRETTSKLLRFAKETDIPIVIIGHVTKEGNIAGPRMLEHMVDVVLYFEGERNHAFRILRANKNRFGSINESGIFSMEEAGLAEVKNPSAMLLSERSIGMPGTVVMTCLEGVRPLLVELQALVSPTAFGMPRRTAAGFDYNRLALLLAVLEKRFGILFSNQDAYINAVGGVRIDEPAADLAVVLALISSLRNLVVDAGTVVMGEVGLTGEVRMIARIESRIAEAAMLGFKRVIVPHGNVKGLKDNKADMKIIGVRDISSAMEAAFM